MTIQTVTLAFSGASGMPYGWRLLACLLNANIRVYLVYSQAAQLVAALETELKLPSQLDSLQTYLCDHFSVDIDRLRVFTPQEWTAPIASGSNPADAMVICPCSSGCVSAIAQGSSDNLLERAADVMIKEQRPLMLVHRETPLSAIHLENLLKLAKLGVTILPANPGFYHKPDNVEAVIDFIVSRILDHLRIPHELVARWGSM